MGQVLAMPPEAAHYLVLRFVIGGLLISLICAAVIKFLERRLTLGQAYLIALVANFTLGVPLAVYEFFKPQLDVSPGLDLSIGWAVLVLMGFMVTRLAANYGIKKEGRFGIGAKFVFATFLMAVLFMIVMAGINLMRFGFEEIPK